MAREMNIDKRENALSRILDKTRRHSRRAEKIAQELAHSFEGDRSPKGKRAARVATRALELARALKKV